MNKPTTHVLLLVDDSGSMSPVAPAVRSGFNEYIDSLIADSEGRYRITVGMFSSDYDTYAEAVKPKNVVKLNTSNYTASGYSTALYDGIGRIISDFDRANPNLSADDKVLLVIQTDGEDNSSHEFTVDQAKQMIERHQAGGWTVLYLGAGQAAWKGGAALGVAKSGRFETRHNSDNYTRSYIGVTRSSLAADRGADSEGVAEAMRSALND